MPDSAGKLVKGYQIVIFVIPEQKFRAYPVNSPVLSQLPFLFHSPLAVLKLHLMIVVDAVVDHIDGVIDLLVLRLDPIGDHHLPLKLLCLIPAGKLLDLLLQLSRFAVCDKLRSRHGIRQEFQLRQLKSSPRQIKSGFRLRRPDDIHTKIHQNIDIPVNALTLRHNPPLCQLFHNFRSVDAVMLIGLPQKDLHNIK